QGGGEGADPFLEPARIVNLVDQTDPQGSLRIDELGRIEQVLGGGGTDQLHYPLDREARINDAEACRRDPEARAAPDESQVAGDGDLAAPADAEARHDGDARP